MRLLLLSRCIIWLVTAFDILHQHNGSVSVLQALISASEVAQVNIPAATGDMGIMSKHEPVIEELRPGVVEVKGLDGASRKWFGASSCFFLFFITLLLHCFRVS